MEVVFWEKAIAGEVTDLTGHKYMDPKTGERFQLEVVSGPTTVPRSIAPHSGYGIPKHINEVTQIILRKAAAR